MRIVSLSLVLGALCAACPAPAQADHPNDGRFIRKVHVEVLGRNPTRAEMDFWHRQLDSGLSRWDVKVSMLASDAYFEHQRRDRSNLIRGLYTHLLNRRPTRAEVNSWLDRWVTYHGEDRGAVVQDFANGARVELDRRSLARGR